MRTESYTIVVQKGNDVEFTATPRGLYINGQRVVQNTGYVLIRNATSDESYLEVALLVTEDLHVFALPFAIVIESQAAVEKA